MRVKVTAMDPRDMLQQAASLAFAAALGVVTRHGTKKLEALAASPAMQDQAAARVVDELLRVLGLERHPTTAEMNATYDVLIADLAAIAGGN